MAENGNRGPNDFRSRNGRRRREPPIIDASATAIPDDGVIPGEPAPGKPVPDEDPRPEPAPDAEPVLFGGARRDPAIRSDDAPTSPAAPHEEGTMPEREPAPEPEAAHATLGPGAPAAAVHDEAASPPEAPLDAEPHGRGPTMDPPTPFGAARGFEPPIRPAASAPLKGGRGADIVPWALTLAIFALLGGIAWLLFTEPQRSGRGEADAALADLKSKVAALETRPDPTPLQASLAALDRRVSAADADRAGLTTTVSALTTRLDGVAADAQGAKAAVDAAAAVAKTAADRPPAAPPAEPGSGGTAAPGGTPPAGAAADGTSMPSPVAAPDPAAAGAVAALAARLGGVDDRLSALSDGQDKAARSLADLSSEQARTAKAVADLPKPVPPDLGPVDAAVAVLAGRFTALEGKVNGNDARLNAFDAKVNGVEAKINGFDTRVNKFDERANEVESKADTAAAALDKLQTTVVNLPKVDLGPLQAAADALGKRVDQVESQLAAPKDGARVTEVRAVGSADEARATPIALVGQAIEGAIASGQPYGPDLDALKALGAEPDAVAKLSPLAAEGAPSDTALKGQWAAVQGDVLLALKPAEAGGALDRFAASARALVQVQAVGTTPGDDPAAVVSRIGGAIDDGDIAAAVAAWDRLPRAGQDKSAAWATAARGRLEAAAAARDLVGRAIATLGRGRS